MIQIAGRCFGLGPVLSPVVAQAALQGLGLPQELSSNARAATTVAHTQGRSRPSQLCPPSPAYEVSLVIKGFELRFVKQASTVIRDLMLVCFAPKSMYVLPKGLGWGEHQLASVQGDQPVALAVPMGDRPLHTRRTLYTVIRGPHVHKTSREQFFRIVHRRIIKYPTTSHLELQWFLDALKSYDFTGVEIKIKLASSSFLTPSPPSGDPASSAGPRPLLADHMARFPHFFPAAALGGGASSATNSGSSSGSSALTALQMARAFQELREGVRSELLNERLALQRNLNYHDWLRQQDAASLSEIAATAARARRGGSGGDGGLAAIGEVVAHELASSCSESGGKLEDALAAAAQKVLVDRGLTEELTGVSDRTAALLAEAPLADKKGDELLDTIYCVLAEGKQQQQQLQGHVHAAPAPSGASSAAAAAYAEVASALVQQLLGIWWEAAQGQLRAELALPDGKRVEAILKAGGKGGKGGQGQRQGREGGGQPDRRERRPQREAERQGLPSSDESVDDPLEVGKMEEVETELLRDLK